MIEPHFGVVKGKMTGTFGEFILSPLPYGYGQSIGNAMRRVLLSSISGYAATYIKINTVPHVFSTIEGIKESVLDIVLNVKQLRFQAQGSGPFTLKLSVKGKKKVYSSELKGDNVTIVNGETLLAELTTTGAALDIELIIEEGVGYSPSEDKQEKEFGLIALDSVFSPIVKTNFKVEGVRVGRVSNFDKLIMEIWTDGTISPSSAFKQSAQTLADFYAHIVSGKQVDPQYEENAIKYEKVQKKDTKAEETIIDELDLPTRVINALLRENIETVSDLIERGKETLVDLKGVGRKSLDLIEKELEKLGLSFSE